MHSNNPIRFLAILVLIVVSATVLNAQSVAATESNSVRLPNAAYADAPASASQQGASATSQFKLGPADVIRVNVWKNTDLSQTVTVGPDGFVSLPVLGDVHVSGMTANQLAQDLTAKLNSYVV